MIRFKCPSCKKILSAPDDKAGMRFACPGCKNPVAVPSPSYAAMQARPSPGANGEDGEAKPFAKRACICTRSTRGIRPGWPTPSSLIPWPPAENLPGRRKGPSGSRM